MHTRYLRAFLRVFSFIHPLIRARNERFIACVLEIAPRRIADAQPDRPALRMRSVPLGDVHLHARDDLLRVHLGVCRQHDAKLIPAVAREKRVCLLAARLSISETLINTPSP